MTPNEVKQKSHTIAAALTTTPLSAGMVVAFHDCHRLAPNTRTAIVGRSSSSRQRAPTTRTTTAMLKYTCANTMMVVDWARPHDPNGPPTPNNAMNAAPTTTVGKANGTSTKVRTSDAPHGRRRSSTYVSGTPISTDIAVEIVACQTVNPMIRRLRPERTTSATGPMCNEPSTQSPRRSTATIGHATK